MVLKFILLLALVDLAKARTSPHADYAQELIRSAPQTRYSTDVKEDTLLDVPALIRKYGYPQETHNIITSDGYMLEMHRIPYGRDNHNTPGPRPPVLIMHGLLSSSADFLVLGPGSALAYILAESGYDVWLGNARGNYYSRRHVSLRPDSLINQNFWKFSWDEIGNIDVAAFVDLILERTGQEKLHYIGHSQGGTTFLVLNSLKPEYNDKFISFQGLAPASYFENNEVELFRSLAPFENVLESAAFTLGMGEIFAKDASESSSSLCSIGILDALCSLDLNSLFESEYINDTIVPVIKAHAPAGASIRQIAHYGQVIRFNAFRRYNYNVITNLANYGRINPPQYDLSKVTVPTYIHYGLSDQEVNYKDIYTLSEKLPNKVGLYRVPRETFTHFDFIWAYDAKVMVYDTMLKLMKEAESKL